MLDKLFSSNNDLNANANALALDASFDIGSQNDIFTSKDPVQRIRRVSSSSQELQADASSSSPVVSANGRFVAFQSNATNLVRGDTNSLSDIFVRDVRRGKTTRVSIGSDGTQANGASLNASISSDGRFVVFESEASNLVPQDTNGKKDVFLHDTKSGTTTLISVDSTGNQADEDSYRPYISNDGRYVTFTSKANNLDSNAPNVVRTEDVFVRDLQTSTTSWIRSPQEGPSPNRTLNSRTRDISGDGRYVLYESTIVTGSVLTTLYVYDQHTQTSQKIDSGFRGDFRKSSISDDGRFVAYGFGPSLGANITKLYDQQTNSSREILLGQNGTRVFTQSLSLSGNGRYLAFSSSQNDVVPGDTNQASDVFIYDIDNSTTQRVSVNARGREANGNSFSPSLSADGRFLAFASDATNLVPRDTNGVTDVFWVKTYSN
ncbi:MAG: hypothetical protein VKL59_25135 [Nostocaceae cyanobacterium]|nr:hypothetical protein [Nostocaceae cyanobacterium]